MTGGITDRISLCLDDAPTEPAIIGIMNHYFANKVARQLHGIHRKFGPTDTPKTITRNRLACAFHLPVRLLQAAAVCESG